MSRTITLEDALSEGIVTPGHYLLTEVPEDRCVITTKNETGINWNQKFEIKAGEEKIWRLVDGLTMVGELTEEKLILKDLEGFLQGPCTMNRVAEKLYSMPDIFEQVRACSLPEKEYRLKDIDLEREVIPELIRKERPRYKHRDDRKLVYWLASRVFLFTSTFMHFGVSVMDRGDVKVHLLCGLHGGTYNPSYAVRPEATSKSTLLLDREGCDGTREKPWRCLGK